jgi:hypothetical protein
VPRCLIVLTERYDIANVTDMDSLTPIAAQFWSTLIGALVAGQLAFLIQWAGYRHAGRLEKTAKREADLTTAIAVLLKVSKMASNLWGIKQHMANALALAATENETGELSWEFVQPVAGKTLDVEFNDAERVFIVTRLRSDFLGVLQLADVHNNLVDIMRIYSDRRIEVGTLLPVHAVSGTQATTNLLDEQLSLLMPRILSMQSLVTPLLKRSKQDMTQAISVFGSVRGVCVREFGKDFPNLVLDPAILAAEAQS